MRYYYAMSHVNSEDTHGLGYGRCVCFVEDADAQHYVILRCYNPYNVDVASGRQLPRGVVVETVDRISQLVPLLLAELGAIDSYMWVPVSSILNGGFILKDPHVYNKHWVVQGFREGNIFQAHNGM
jgi:hypothetical protein